MVLPRRGRGVKSPAVASQVPLAECGDGRGALRASGIAVDDAILRAGIRDAMLPDAFR